MAEHTTCPQEVHDCCDCAKKKSDSQVQEEMYREVGGEA